MTRRAYFIAAFLIAAATTTLPAQTTNAASATNAPPAAPASPFPNAIPTAEVITKAEAALAQYPAPPATPVPDHVETDVRQAMAERDPELQLFSDETERLLAQNPSLDSIRTLENHGSYFASFPAAWTTAITDRTKQLGRKLDQVTAERQAWTDTQGELRSANPPAAPEILKRTSTVLARFDAVKTDITARQSGLLDLENEVTDRTNAVAYSINQLDTARDRAISQLFEANAPPVWSGQLMPAVPESDSLGWSNQLKSLAAYFKSGPGKFLIHALLFVLLIGCFFWLRGYARKLTIEEPGITAAARIFEMPVSTAALLAILASPLLYYPLAPRLLSAILGAIALIPSVILLRRLIEPRLFPILNALVIFFFLEEFRSVAELSPEAGRAFLLAEILGAISFVAWMLLALRHHGAQSPRFSKAMRLGAWAAFATLAVGWLAEVLGFTLMANFICIAVQRSATLALTLYAGIRILDALLFILMRLRPLSGLGMVKMHGPMLMQRTQRVFAWIAALVWIFLTLELLPLSSSLVDVLFGSRANLVARSTGFLGSYHADSGFKLNFLGKVLVALLIGWGVFQVSRFVRFVLATEFYPRMRLGAGVPYAISMSLHYVMLTLAFIGATYVLGIDMTKFTILVSALGVGVGFGLQNIINNFVSGLILLFERPIKIGDSVQTGDAAGVVERIGIRASVLRTAGGTEVIVPNGSLISNNVTNWTLSSEERIILIPLNVPRGPDVPHLIDLLTKAAAAHPKVLKQPPPQVQAQTLGVNLGIELRAWTRAVDDWGGVRSDIVLAINEALTKENITLA
jgi:small-conductance mechanosensitive channel